jgi:glycosyltransferase involved in cell wall biosynthesis
MSHCEFTIRDGAMARCVRCSRRVPARVAGTVIARCGAANTVSRTPAVAPPRTATVEEAWPVDADGQLIPQSEMTAEDLPCPHRRDKLPAQGTCNTCGQVGQPFNVFGCTVNGQCSLTRKRHDVANCLQCPTRRAALVQLDTQPPTPKRTGPVRVVFFSPGLLGGGAERWIVTLCKSWHTDVVATGVVLADWGGSEPGLVAELSRCGVTVYGSRSTPTDSANAPQVVRCDGIHAASTRALANADVVISWGWGEVGDVLKTAGWTGPHVVVSHGACEWSMRLLDKPSRTATHLAAVSERAALSFPNELQDRVKVLWNGIELERVMPSRDRNDVRRSWGCDPDELLVGYLGRHAMSKRPEAVALAVAELRRQGRNARGVWIGAGTHTDILKPLCEEIAPGGCVWVEPPDHVGDALAALDCFMLASPSEGMSLALCEAWAAGVPTVATPVGAVEELEKAFGQLTCRVPVGATAEELADAVEVAMIGDVVHHAREVTLREFTAARMARRWADYLRQVVS